MMITDALNFSPIHHPDASVVHPPDINTESGQGVLGANEAQQPQVVSTITGPHNTQSIYPGLAKNSAALLNYRHGVNLAEAIEPGASQRMTREELIALPGKMNSEAVIPEQELLIAATRVAPTIDWAVANGILPKRTTYSNSDIYTASSLFDQHVENLTGALISLATPMPMRKDYFLGSQQVSPIKGHNDPNNKTYPVAVYDDRKFGEDFNADLKDKKMAYATTIKQLVSTLPLEDRVSIELGEVELYALKPPGSNDKLDRDNFLIKVFHKGKVTAYEVNPKLGFARKRHDYIGVFNGSSVIGKKQLPDGSYSQEFTGWNKPNLQNNQYRPKSERHNLAKPNNEPFFAQLHTLEKLGKFPPLSPGVADNEFVPQTLFSQRSNDLAGTIAKNLFYAKDLDLLDIAQKDPERVTQEEQQDRENYEAFRESRERRRELLKGFVPFWHGVEAIIAGRPIEGVARIWMDILWFTLPLGKFVSSVFKGGYKIIKSTIPQLSKLTKNMFGYSTGTGIPGIKWDGGVQGLKWTGNVSDKLGKGISVYRQSASPISKTGLGIREIELNGAKYFVAGKPDAGDGVHYLLRVPNPKDPSKLVRSGVVATMEGKGVWRPKIGSSSVSQVPKSNTLQLGGPMKDLKMIANEVHTYVDVLRQKAGLNLERLNIVAHGVERGWGDRFLGKGTQVVIDNTLYTPKQLIALLKSKGVDPGAYSSVRLLICHSAEGGAKSFAARFQHLINKPVKAYDGSVTISFGSSKITQIRNKLAEDIRANFPLITKKNAESLAEIRLQQAYNGYAVPHVEKIDGQLFQINTAPQGMPPVYEVLRIDYKPKYFNR